MPTTALQKIVTEAKKLQKQHPRMEWKAAIQKASKRYKAGTLGKPAAAKKAAVKRKPAKKAAAKRPAAKRPAARVQKSKPVKVGLVPHGTVVSHVNAAIKLLEGSLQANMLRHFNAKTKAEKRQISKAIADTKQQIKRLKSKK